MHVCEFRTLDLVHLLDREVQALSGGELQRFAIAATVIREADVYMFDEASSFLDVKQRMTATDVIRRRAIPNVPLPPNLATPLPFALFRTCLCASSLHTWHPFLGLSACVLLVPSPCLGCSRIPHSPRAPLLARFSSSLDSLAFSCGARDVRAHRSLVNNDGSDESGEKKELTDEDKRSRARYVIVVEHDLAVLDYMSDYICCLYGEAGAYGVVTKIAGVRNGINNFLAGYIPVSHISHLPLPCRGCTCTSLCAGREYALPSGGALFPRVGGGSPRPARLREWNGEGSHGTGQIPRHEQNSREGRL